MNHFGRDQRDYIRFRESDSAEDERNTDGSFTRIRDEESNMREQKSPRDRYRGINRFGEERIRHDSFQDDQFRKSYDPTYEDEYGMKHPYEHGGHLNRWSDDIRSEASREKTYTGHFGKGPKGYQRSHEKILEDANEILTRDANLDASEIQVEVQGDILVLKGDVSNRQEKKHAEALVEDISGIRDVHNHLTIRKDHLEGWVPGLGQVSDEEQGGINGKG